ncbi:MAG: chemotaxis protein CheB [Chloroflexi bacterium]|nr:chemotaxis protein CheB [Chloroflexota bacterium]
MTATLVVVGTSFGGFAALKTLLGGLPGDFPLPIAIVQHRRGGESELAGLLAHYTVLPVADAEDKDEIQPARVYLAPGGYHLLVERGSFALSVDEPVQYARPSVDVLFESAADVYGTGVIGVVLTGAGRDGAAGLARVKARGGVAIVQDPSTAVRCTMPAAALSSVQPDAILPLAEIPAYLTSLVGRSAASVAGMPGYDARPPRHRADLPLARSVGPDPARRASVLQPHTPARS